MEYSRGLSDAAGAPVWLKLESMQLTGSFKIRGALFRISKLTAEERRDGIITCSAGNHGIAVAYAAREAGVCAVVCVPRSVDGAKLEAMAALGASVRISEFDGYDETEEWSREIAAEERLTFISAFDDYAIMAANGGTVAMEAIDDVAVARAFVLPVGGGGLSAGFAWHAKDRLPGSTIIGCQHVLSPALRMSLEAGRAITKLPAAKTLAGGVEGGIGALAFGVLQSRIDRIALVSEDEILEGVRWMAANHQYLIEPTAAVTIAACLSGKIGEITQPAVVVVSGRNVSAGTLKTILCKS